MVTLQLAAALLLGISGIGKSLDLDCSLEQKDNDGIEVQQSTDYEEEDGDSLKETGSPLVAEPPPYTAFARVARYIVHNSDWTSIATISTRVAVKGYPTANVFSVSDGSTIETSKGIPYFYLAEKDISVLDLKVDKRTAIAMTLAQGSYCREPEIDPENPLCARIILTGKMIKLEPGKKEEALAKDALFTRHPGMKTWAQRVPHGFIFTKLDIENIWLLDYFGLEKIVPLKEYFDATPY